MTALQEELQRAQKILKQKEHKLQKYKECNKQWLLIWGYDLPNSYYNKVEIEEEVNTIFDKIFFAHLGRYLTEIKTSS